MTRTRKLHFYKYDQASPNNQNKTTTTHNYRYSKTVRTTKNTPTIKIRNDKLKRQQNQQNHRNSKTIKFTKTAIVHENRYTVQTTKLPQPITIATPKP